MTLVQALSKPMGKQQESDRERQLHYGQRSVWPDLLFRMAYLYPPWPICEVAVGSRVEDGLAKH